jgi:hypothetical protein
MKPFGVTMDMNVSDVHMLINVALEYGQDDKSAYHDTKGAAAMGRPYCPHAWRTSAKHVFNGTLSHDNRSLGG